MELDELKENWKQIPVHKNQNTDIMEIIQHKSYGPISALKSVFRKQILLMAIIPFVLVLTNSDNIPGVLTSVMFWGYVAFCSGVIAFAYYNYTLAKAMENLNEMVRVRLERQIDLLEKRMRWELIGLRCALLFFILLTEIVPYFQNYRMLNKWHSLNPLIRYGCYVALILIQYFLNRKLARQKVSRHIDYLRSLVREMRD